MLPATSASLSAATSRAIRRALPVERLEVVLAPDRAQLLAVAVVGERDHHLGAGAEHLAMELPHGLGEVEHDLRHERPGLEVAAPLELEQVTLGSQDDTPVEPLANPSHAGGSPGRWAASRMVRRVSPSSPSRARQPRHASGNRSCAGSCARACRPHRCYARQGVLAACGVLVLDRPFGRVRRNRRQVVDEAGLGLDAIQPRRDVRALARVGSRVTGTVDIRVERDVGNAVAVAGATAARRKARGRARR